MNKIDGIILAGGRGTRLKSIISQVPKPLALVNGKPLLDILLSQLNKYYYIRKVVIAVGYMSEKITDRYKDCSDYNFKITFSVEKKLLGTGGAIKKAIKHTRSGDIIVLNGDSYVEVNIEDLIRTHRNNNADITIVLKEVNNTSRYGKVEIDTEKKIICFQEKKTTDGPGLINAGIYLMKRALFDDIKEYNVISLEKELLPKFVENNAYGYVVHGKFIDIGSPESYKIADTYLKEIVE